MNLMELIGRLNEIADELGSVGINPASVRIRAVTHTGSVKEIKSVVDYVPMLESTVIHIGK